MKYKKCKICKLTWNISIKTDLSNGYVCPQREEKSNKRNGIVSKVLLKNKNKLKGE